MLQFLQSWLWAFAAVAALPVILHLLSRQRLKKIKFSSLMLLAKLEKSQMRRLRLRQLLLLILRTLAILTIVFAFARPLIRNQESPILGEETAAILVVDQSASMSAMGSRGRRIDRARAFARRIIESLGSGDRLATLPDTGSAYAPIFMHDDEDWGGLVDSLRAKSGRADLGAALEAARAALDSMPVGSRELYIVTDGQRSSWSTLPQPLQSDVRVYIARVADELQPNRSVRSLDFGGSLWIAHASLEARVTIVNVGPEIRDLPVSLFLDGNRVAQQSVTIARNDSELVSLQVSDLEPGWHYGRVAISSDSWPDDNMIYFALEAVASLPVLLVGDNKDLLTPVRAALRPGPTARTPFEPEAVTSATFATDIDPRMGLVVLAGVKAIPASGWERLLRFVRGGGGLWVLLDPQSDEGNYNRNLLEPIWGTSMTVLDAEAKSESFVTLESPARHALFSYMESIPRFPEIRFRRRARIGTVAASSVRQRFSDGSPAMLEAQVGAGRIVLTTGFAHPDESDLVYHPLFVPMVQATASYIARRGALGTDPYYDVGQRATGMPGPQGNWSWVAPGGDTLSLPGGPLKLPILATSGIFALLLDSKPVAYFAANIESDETSLDPVVLWEDVLGNVAYTELHFDGSVADQITQARVGLDLWYPALILALLFLLAEMFVAWPRESELEP